MFHRLVSIFRLGLRNAVACPRKVNFWVLDKLPHRMKRMSATAQAFGADDRIRTRDPHLGKDFRAGGDIH
jgi:hypothetical protein